MFQTLLWRLECQEHEIVLWSMYYMQTSLFFRIQSKIFILRYRRRVYCLLGVTLVKLNDVFTEQAISIIYFSCRGLWLEWMANLRGKIISVLDVRSWLSYVDECSNLRVLLEAFWWHLFWLWNENIACSINLYAVELSLFIKFASTCSAYVHRIWVSFVVIFRF